MSDEPVEDGDSGSDARGASSPSGSEESPVDGDADDADDPSTEPDDPTTDADDADDPSTDADESTSDGDTGTSADPPTDESGTPDDQPSAGEGDAPVSDHAPAAAEAPTPDEGEPASAPPSADPADASEPGDGGDGGSSFLSGGIGGSAPPDDEEMPLTEHIEEMLTRLGIVVVIAAFATLAAFPLANDLIIHMWYDVHYGTVEACKSAPQSGDCVAPHVYGPLELVLTRIRVAGLAGLLVALPLGIYQTYRFMRPGLYPHERRYFLASIPFSLVLAIVGMVFAYFVLLPLLFAYFISYTQGSAELAFQLAETMNLILLMMGMLAIIFQIPLLIMLAIMMGITTRRWLERRRLYFWGLFLGVGVIFGPDPTGMAPVLLTATMVALFEGTLLLLRWTGR